MTVQIEVGPCELWVEAGPLENGAGFKVHCQRCGGTDFAYVPYLAKHPEAPGEWAKHHARCRERKL